MTYSELVSRMSAAELVDIWLPLARIDGPWGEWRDDLRAARVAAAVAGGAPADYMPRPWTAEAEEAEYRRLQESFRQSTRR